MKIGYARVSTDDQTPALRLAALKRAGCKTVFKDGDAGSRERPPCLAPLSQETRRRLGRLQSRQAAKKDGLPYSLRFS